MYERCFQHLQIAKDAFDNDMEEEKASTIIDSWRRGMGVYVISCFHSATREEAFNREACAIKFMGLDNLTNKYMGHLNGATCLWSPEMQHNYGMLVLYIMYLNFINQNTACIYNDDIKVKKPRK